MNQALFYNSKESSMIEKCLLASTEISGLEIMNNTTVAKAVSDMGNIKLSHLIITDRNGIALYVCKECKLQVIQYSHHVQFACVSV